MNKCLFFLLFCFRCFLKFFKTHDSYYWKRGTQMFCVLLCFPLSFNPILSQELLSAVTQNVQGSRKVEAIKGLGLVGPQWERSFFVSFIPCGYATSWYFPFCTACTSLFWITPSPLIFGGLPPVSLLPPNSIMCMQVYHLGSVVETVLPPPQFLWGCPLRSFYFLDYFCCPIAGMFDSKTVIN